MSRAVRVSKCFIGQLFGVVPVWENSEIVVANWISKWSTVVRLRYDGVAHPENHSLAHLHPSVRHTRSPAAKNQLGLITLYPEYNEWTAQ